MFVYRRLEEERQNQLRYNRMKMKQYDRVSCTVFLGSELSINISCHLSLFILPENMDVKWVKLLVVLYFF